MTCCGADRALSAYSLPGCGHYSECEVMAQNIDWKSAWDGRYTARWRSVASGVLYKSIYRIFFMCVDKLLCRVINLISAQRDEVVYRTKQRTETVTKQSPIVPLCVFACFRGPQLEDQYIIDRAFTNCSVYTVCHLSRSGQFSGLAVTTCRIWVCVTCILQ